MVGGSGRSKAAGVRVETVPLLFIAPGILDRTRNPAALLQQATAGRRSSAADYVAHARSHGPDDRRQIARLKTQRGRRARLLLALYVLEVWADLFGAIAPVSQNSRAGARRTRRFSLGLHRLAHRRPTAPLFANYQFDLAAGREKK